MNIRELIKQLEQIILQNGHEEIQVSVWVPSEDFLGIGYYSEEIEIGVYQTDNDIEASIVSRK